ncbi:MAG: glycosyltransferase [Pyrinomonadaceae bacterium]
MANIVLVTKGTNGDLFPFLGIGKALKARGHDVVVVTNWYGEQEVSKAGLDFVALDNPDEVPSYEEQTTLDGLSAPADELMLVGSHTAAPHASGGDAGEGARRLSVFGMPLKRGLLEYEAISGQCRRAEKKDTVLVVNYVAFFSARHVADALGLPVAAVFIAPSMFPQWVLDLSFFDELYTHVGGDLNRIRAEVGLPPVRDWRAWLLDADRMLGLWAGWFAPEGFGAGREVTPIGFPSDPVAPGEVPAEVARDFDPADPPLLITHGTSIPAKSDFFAAAAEACRLAGVPALLVCKHERLIPSELPERVKWHRYVPFGRLMPHVRGIIHHGGIGTCGQALAAGIPQLVLALGYDRADNAARLQSLGVAEALTPLQWRAEVLADSLRRLLGGEDVRRRCAEYARALRGSDFGAAGADAIEELAADRTRRRAGVGTSAEVAEVEAAAAPRTKRESGDLQSLLDKLSPAGRELLRQRLKGRLGADSRGK